MGLKMLELKVIKDRCVFCKKRETTKLCDFEIGKTFPRTFQNVNKSVTCDRHMCDTCATKIMFNKDICPICVKRLKEQLKVKE